MAESSFLWTTGGAGDGSATYTRTNWSDILKVVAACMDEEGVATGYLNALAPSANGANTVRVATGGALVDGKPYLNSANNDINIPSAVGGGNTRIDRIVLRASWAAQTVRLTRIAGTDAASPSAPAITQTSGTTYDIMICQALVTTGGVVTVTDERVFAKPGTNTITTAALTDLSVTTAKIALLNITTALLNDLAVTTAKIAADAVDDTKVGDRVPQFYRRQGGNASDWSVAGTTSRTPTSVRMQAGVIAVPTGGSGVTITFPTAFSQPPVFVCTPSSNNPNTFQAAPISATQAVIVHDHAGTIDFHWIAIGPE